MASTNKYLILVFLIDKTLAVNVLPEAALQGKVKDRGLGVSQLGVSNQEGPDRTQ